MQIRLSVGEEPETTRALLIFERTFRMHIAYLLTYIVVRFQSTLYGKCITLHFRRWREVRSFGKYEDLIPGKLISTELLCTY